MTGTGTPGALTEPLPARIPAPAPGERPSPTEKSPNSGNSARATHRQPWCFHWRGGRDLRRSPARDKARHSATSRNLEDRRRRDNAGGPRRSRDRNIAKQSAPLQACRTVTFRAKTRTSQVNHTDAYRRIPKHPTGRYTRHITRSSSTDRSICGRRIPPGKRRVATMHRIQSRFPWSPGERHVSAITRHVSDHTGPNRPRSAPGFRTLTRHVPAVPGKTRTPSSRPALDVSTPKEKGAAARLIHPGGWERVGSGT